MILKVIKNTIYSIILPNKLGKRIQFKMVESMLLIPIIVMPIMFIFGLSLVICGCIRARRIRREHQLLHGLHQDQRIDYKPVYQPQSNSYSPVYQPQPIGPTHSSYQPNDSNPQKNIYYQPNPFVNAS